MTAEHPVDPNFVITLPSFTGPLDLLLHLIQKHELDILDLPIAFVTERYLSYIELMNQLDLDIAAEYLLMAATLAHIKSKMLLPTPPTDQEDAAASEEEVDPRSELIRRLLEYQKYKAVAEELGARGIAGRDVFFRGTEAPEAQGQAPLAEVGLYKLLDAFQGVLQRAKFDVAQGINAERITIQDRMMELTEKLRSHKRVRFDELFDGLFTRYDIIVTFMAILEMAKMRLLRCYQADPESPIHLESAVTDESAQTDSISAESEPEVGSATATEDVPNDE